MSDCLQMNILLQRYLPNFLGVLYMQNPFSEIVAWKRSIENLDVGLFKAVRNNTILGRFQNYLKVLFENSRPLPNTNVFGTL